MKHLLTLSILLSMLISINAHAIKISEYQFYDYKVVFTNPICKTYAYEDVVYANDGEVIRSKPKNVFCKRSDYELNYNRQDTPNFELRKLIGNPNVKEMFLTYLSFSDAKIAKSLCDAIESRNLKVTFIIDSKNSVGARRRSAMKRFDEVAKCRAKDEVLLPGEKAHIPQMHVRGNKKGLGYAHNKLIIAHYKTPKKVTLVFSSGNMSSGTLIHHENWHFLTTSEDSYFYQTHACLREGMLNHGESKKDYQAYLSSCRSKIAVSDEEDIKAFFVPSDGDLAMSNILKNIEKSQSVDIAVHRFTHKDLMAGLSSAAKEKRVRFIADDDIYWTGKLRKRVGSNTPNEYYNMNTVRRAGADVRYMQTNEKSFLLHHNKMIVFNYPDGTGAVHAGAGNFTKAAFTQNFENYYFITIPEVVTIFKQQYDYLFNELASSWEKLPVEYVTP